MSFLWSHYSLLRERRANLSQRETVLHCWLRAKASVYVSDVIVFVSCRGDIKAVKQMLSRYEKVSETTINLEKSEGMRVRVWFGGFLLPSLFR